MTICIISDIHANLPALEAVFEEHDRLAPDMTFCLGDLVGYAPWPNEVVELVGSRHIPTIMGNYDQGVGYNSDDCGCAYATEQDRERGAASIAYTNQTVGEPVRRYLRSLPRQIRLEFGQGTDAWTMLLVHGSPRRINEYLFEDRTDASLERIMADADADVMLFGHTHKPYHRRLERRVDGAPHYRHAINTGSVGKPKDGDPRACMVMLEWSGGDVRTDVGALSVVFHRVVYDVERAAVAIERSPLPDAFAEMLRRGC